MPKKIHDTIGIDEVGRGPLAGPVCVCALALSKEKERELRKEARKKKFADSKQLSEKERIHWALWSKKQGIPYRVSCVSPAMIDRIRIHNAVNKAAQRAYQTLPATKGSNVIADGSIQIKAQNFASFSKADETLPAVALASIIAKVHRDRLMGRLHAKYEKYDFITNKGYGTKKHIASLAAYGPTDIHRLTFIKKYTILKKR